MDNQARSITSVEDARELLRNWREEVVRRSDDVVDLWDSFLCDSLSDLGDEKYMILEQVAVAAMDTDREDVVLQCLKELHANFDRGSMRVRRLEAMYAEMCEDWDAALALLDQLLEEDETNSQARKRKIAVLIAQGENHKAIGELKKYLGDFACDQEAWGELCDLYVQEQDYSKAAFCCEELILHNPHNQLYYQRYAEIKYTQGGFDQLEMAKTYYCKTISLNKNNMRALYGLLLTSAQLASSPKSPTQKKKENTKMVMWAAKQIVAKYNQVQNQQQQSSSATTVPSSNDADFSSALLEGLLGQLHIQPPVAS